MELPSMVDKHIEWTTKKKKPLFKSGQNSRCLPWIQPMVTDLSLHPSLFLLGEGTLQDWTDCIHVLYQPATLPYMVFSQTLLDMYQNEKRA